MSIIEAIALAYGWDMEDIHVLYRDGAVEVYHDLNTGTVPDLMW